MGRPKGSKNKPKQPVIVDQKPKERRKYGEITFYVLEAPPKGEFTLFTYTEDEQGAHDLVRQLETVRPKNKFKIVKKVH